MLSPAISVETAGQVIKSTVEKIWIKTRITKQARGMAANPIRLATTEECSVTEAVGGGSGKKRFLFWLLEFSTIIKYCC
jgi:hypothetical protein